jgi:hypothetical protein
VAAGRNALRSYRLRIGLFLCDGTGPQPRTSWRAGIMRSLAFKGEDVKAF